MTDVATRERVAIEISDHVATVTLTRPEKHNALDVAMFEAISAAAERVAGEPGVRAVVLHGEGPSFCSGLDVAGGDGRISRTRTTSWPRCAGRFPTGSSAPRTPGSRCRCP